VTPARAASLTAQEMVNEYPIDLLEVRLDDGEASIVAVAHVVARSPLTRGGRLRGRILAVMNAEFLGTWDLAPRGHPNDGRVEVVEVDPSMSIRDRLHARGRLPTGTHVPHPSITTRSIRSASWRFEPALDVVVDGRRVGRASSMSIDVAADAASVYG
jgi:diacylglycerol kinase family enzyme